VDLEYRFVVRSLRPFLVGSAALIVLALPGSAHAAPDAKDLPSETPSFYLYGSPGFFAVPLGDDDVEDDLDFSYQWGFGLGGLFGVGPKRGFGIGIGFAFEHNPFTLDDDIRDPCDDFDIRCSAHAFRFLPELRLGWLWKQLFVYGYAAPGFGMTFVHVDEDSPFFRDDVDDVDPGFNFGFGGGVQYVVYKGLFIGGEIGADLGIYFEDDDPDDWEVAPGRDDDYGLYLLDFKALIGYYF
jgi:hypothetical protein